MSGFEPLVNLRSAKATRALLLLSIFLFSAGPGLAAGLAPTTAGMPRTEFSHGNLYNYDPAPTINHGIDELSKQWLKDLGPTKEIHIDRELQSQGKDQDTITHEETVRHVGPNPNNNTNNNRNNNCESSSGDLSYHTFDSDASACKNRTRF